MFHVSLLGGVDLLARRCAEYLGGRLTGQLKTGPVFDDVGCRARVNHGRGDGPVHHAASCLLVNVVKLGSLEVAEPLVTLGVDHVVVPRVEGWTVVAEVAEPLIVSGGVPSVSSWWR